MQEEQRVVLLPHLHGQKSAWTERRLPRLEPRLLGEERRHVLLHPDHDLLGLGTLGDVPGVAGHLVDDRLVDDGAHHLVDADDVSLLGGEVVDDRPERLLGLLLLLVGRAEVLDVPRDDAECLGHGGGFLLSWVDSRWSSVRLREAELLAV